MYLLQTAAEGSFKQLMLGSEEWEFIPETIQSAGAMYSTTNDLLKYLSANIGLLRTNIYDSMQDTHLIRHTFGQSSETSLLKTIQV